MPTPPHRLPRITDACLRDKKMQALPVRSWWTGMLCVQRGGCLESVGRQFNPEIKRKVPERNPSAESESI